MGIHENILRRVVEGDDGDDRTQDSTDIDSVRKHILLLKQTFLRLRGWDKDIHVYRDLVHSVLSLPQYKGRSELKSTDLHVEHWHLKDPADDKIGKFSQPSNWEFANKKDLDDKGDIKYEEFSAKRRPGIGMKRVTSHWGISEVKKVLYGDFASLNDRDQGQSIQPYTNGHSQKDRDRAKTVSINGNSNVKNESATTLTNTQDEAGYHTPEEEL